MHEVIKTPETLSEWLGDVQDAYAMATQSLNSGDHLTDLFKLAAPIVTARRGVSAQDTIEAMARHVVERVDSDLELGGSLSDYKFHFVYSYIHAHTQAGVIDEFQADDVMGYVNDHWDLFDESA